MVKNEDDSPNANFRAAKTYLSSVLWLLRIIINKPLGASKPLLPFVDRLFSFIILPSMLLSNVVNVFCYMVKYAALILAIVVSQSTAMFDNDNPDSPTLPLVAAALFLVLDMLVLQTRLIPSVRRDLFLWEAVTLVFAMAYCSSMSAFKIVEFVRSPDRGAAAPGIHFHPARSGGGDPLQEVLRDTPFSAALFATGILGVIVGLVLVLAVLLLKRRQCRG